MAQSQYNNLRKFNPVDSSRNSQNKADSTDNIASMVPPHSLEAEVSVLGSIIQSRKAFSKIMSIIDEDAFYKPAHSSIFLAAKNIFDKGINIDLLTISEELKKLGKLEEVGGNQYLAELTRRAPGAANVEQHSLIVLEKHLKRSLIEVSGEILTRAYDDSNDAVEEIDQAEQMIFKLAEKRFSKSYKALKEVAHEAYEFISSLAAKDKDGVTGVPTGFKELDKMLGGFHNSDLIIVAARPSMGKTALGLSIALNVAVYNQIPTAFFSIEMSSTQIAVRLISAESRIDQQSIRTGKLRQDDHDRIIKSLGRLSDAPFIIDDSPMLNILELKAKCRRLKAEHDIKLIIIDYLQLIHAPKAESREREISIISQTLKQIAKELEIPVISLAQLNRSVESRTDKRPMLSDLRESGSIEQDADVVMFVNRPERYGIMEFEDGSSTENMGEIIVGKQRNGPTGIVRLAFQKDYARFMDPIFVAEDQPQSARENYGKHLQNPDLMPNDSEDAPF